MNSEGARTRYLTARVQLQLRGGGVTVTAETYIYLVLVNNWCVGSVAVIYGEVCSCTVAL